MSTWDTAVREARESGKEDLAADAYVDFQRASVKLKRRETALKEYLASTGREREWYREQTGGWNRSVSAKAVWANRKAKK